MSVRMLVCARRPPPLETLRYVNSHAATWAEGEARRGVMINDARRAYSYAKATRDLYIELPAEDPEAGRDKLGKLKLCLYGTRDAAKGWQETLSLQLDHVALLEAWDTHRFSITPSAAFLL